MDSPAVLYPITPAHPHLHLQAASREPRMAAAVALPGEMAPRLPASRPLHTERIWDCRRTSSTPLPPPQKAGSRNGAHFHPKVSMVLVMRSDWPMLALLQSSCHPGTGGCDAVRRGLIVPDLSPLDFIFSCVKWERELLHRVIIVMR